MQQILDFTPADVAEARKLVADLDQVFDTLKIQDQRYVTTWKIHLDKNGAVGSKRLIWLRATHADYFKQEEMREAA